MYKAVQQIVYLKSSGLKFVEGLLLKTTISKTEFKRLTLSTSAFDESKQDRP